ncbi:hypothetical protein ACFLZ9_01065 [Patescibacteria group bacterium]
MVKFCDDVGCVIPYYCSRDWNETDFSVEIPVGAPTVSRVMLDCPNDPLIPLGQVLVTEQAGTEFRMFMKYLVYVSQPYNDYGYEDYGLHDTVWEFVRNESHLDDPNHEYYLDPAIEKKLNQLVLQNNGLQIVTEAFLSYYSHRPYCNLRNSSASVEAQIASVVEDPFPFRAMSRSREATELSGAGEANPYGADLDAFEVASLVAALGGAFVPPNTWLGAILLATTLATADLADDVQNYQDVAAPTLDVFWEPDTRYVEKGGEPLYFLVSASDSQDIRFGPPSGIDYFLVTTHPTDPNILVQSGSSRDLSGERGPETTGIHVKITVLEDCAEPDGHMFTLKMIVYDKLGQASTPMYMDFVIAENTAEPKVYQVQVFPDSISMYDTTTDLKVRFSCKVPGDLDRVRLYLDGNNHADDYSVEFQQHQLGSLGLNPSSDAVQWGEINVSNIFCQDGSMGGGRCKGRCERL